ncbi:steroid delta-isomerase [Fulvivirga sp. M361]|nr:steroid delta-isomerase [Fulvivirga sp. M361]
MLLLINLPLLAQKSATDLAQQQLDAYNHRDIEAFLLPYSDTVKVFNFPAAFLYQGIEEMRKRYSPMFEKQKDLHCTLVNRMSLGNMVIDQESVIFDKTKPPVEVFAIYKVAANKIQEVYFMRPD